MAKRSLSVVLAQKPTHLLHSRPPPTPPARPVAAPTSLATWHSAPLLSLPLSSLTSGPTRALPLSPHRSPSIPARWPSRPRVPLSYFSLWQTGHAPLSRCQVGPIGQPHPPLLPCRDRASLSLLRQIHTHLCFLRDLLPEINRQAPIKDRNPLHVAFLP